MEPQGGSGLSGRHTRLARRTVLVSAMTLVSRVLGFVREVISAALFGDKAGIFDAFLTAWRIPNLFRRFLGEGALSTALVTRLTEVDHNEGEAAGRALFLSTVRLVAGILAAIAGSCMLLAHFLPSFASEAALIWTFGEDWHPVLELTVRVMPFVVLVCLAALFAGALQVRGHFLSPMLAPVFFNTGWILALVIIGMHFGWSSPFEAGSATGLANESARQLGMTRWLAWGVLAAGALQVTCQIPALYKMGFLGGPRATSAPNPKGAWSVLRTSAPLAFGAAVYQINVMIDGFMAISMLDPGGPTAHYYANRVQQFPFALIALAATSSVFPKLKELGHHGQKSELRSLHDKTQLGIAFLAMPASVGLLVLAAPISKLLFEHGAFGSDGTARVALALGVLALALLPAGAVSLVTRAYYAVGDFRTPVLVSGVLLVANVGLNLLFVGTMEMDVEGLALATVITSWANWLILMPILRRRVGGQSQAGNRRNLAQIGLASLAAGAASYGVQAWAAAWLAGYSTLGEAVALGLAAVVGVGGYFVVAAQLGVPQWQEFRARIRRS